jgi:2-dehydro-3-deoxy-D-gluconate 5-dehydrogenase
MGQQSRAASESIKGLTMFDLTGKAAIVTGASRGIGGAIAIGLAQAGADVLLVSRTEPEQAINEALAKTGRKFFYHSADLSRMDSVSPVMEAALGHFGKVDILINNAGTVRRTSFLEHSEEEWDFILNLNLKIPVFLAQAVARQMVKQGQGGKIVNICSMLSFQGGINIMSYTASKHGLAGVTKLMANELAKHNINVNGLAPGYIETANTEALRQNEARFTAISARIPAGHWGKPEDMAGAAVFMCSEAANYMNGHILAVDGGWLAS